MLVTDVFLSVYARTRVLQGGQRSPPINGLRFHLRPSLVSFFKQNRGVVLSSPNAPLGATGYFNVQPLPKYLWYCAM